MSNLLTIGMDKQLYRGINKVKMAVLTKIT